MGEIDRPPGIRGWFRQPPRRHGEIIEERSVSPLELLYDLVFVVFVSQIARTLAADVSARRMLDFVVLFGLVWVAWFNGTQFHELHGREDGRGRSFIFLQMGILAVVAVYAPHATGGDGERFAWAFATGVLCLGIGFGCWWMYFDFVGDRLPRTARGAVAAWMFSHLPTTLTIAGAGAGMASLVKHAHDGRTPTASSWLIAAAVAGLLVSLLMATRALIDYERQARVYRPLTPALLAAAGAALVLGALHPAPWLLALGLVALLSATWWVAFLRPLSHARPAS